MPSIVKTLSDRKLISPPKFLPTNVHYETIMGSIAYGVSDDTSDEDVYGFCIPPKEILFPHLAGEIHGFTPKAPRFEQYQQHHIQFSPTKEYDICIYNIVKYFKLCMDCNPNMIDSMFTPVNCIKHSTSVGNMVREKRKIFLSKKAWHTFKGYSYSQLYKMDVKKFEGSEKRRAEVERYGYSVKFAYHVVRLLNEVEQILTTGDIDLRQDKQRLKAIRRGEWTREQVQDFFETKQKELESLYTSSKLPHSPDTDAIESLLMNCLEEHYGDLSSVCVRPTDEGKYLRKIRKVLDESGY